jgi:hypothetical protein
LCRLWCYKGGKIATIWTEEEIKILAELRGQGIKVDEIANRLGRSFFSVENKLREASRREWRRNKNKPKPVIPEVIPEIPLVPNPTAQKKRFDLEYSSKDIITTYWLYDSHFPWNLPIEPLLNYCKEHPPDIFGFGGDNWSLDCISHWNQGKFKNYGMDNVIAKFNEECRQFKAHIGRFIEALPNTKFVYIMGNHEDWLNQFAAEFPQTHKPTIQSVLGEYAKFIEFVPQGGFYQIGKLYFAHGDQFGTANPAKQAVERTNKTVVFGHHHVYKVWPQFSMVDDEEKHLGIGVPCFCGLSPEYGKGRPNQWMNGFFMASVKRKSGNFTPIVVPTDRKGNFMLYGKEYF